MCLVGRYKEKENAIQTVQQLEKLQYIGDAYKDLNYVVIAKIILDQQSSNTIAKDLSKNGVTCVVKEYLIGSDYQDDIKMKHIKMYIRS